MERQKYPIGKQVFQDIRERNFVYIDKTQYIMSLLDGSDFYFLSRPRRFGKSLFLSTLQCLFEGKKEFFKGLAIETYDWEWVPYPIIRLDMGGGTYSSLDGLKTRCRILLDLVSKKYDVYSNESEPGERLGDLIRLLHEKYGRKVVILVDEYEKPLLDSLEKPHFESFKHQLHDLYSAFKDNEEHIRLLFITGITRFGKLNIFSGLNNLDDISFSGNYSGICGITEDEMLRYLRPGIERFAAKQGVSFEKGLETLKFFYDGYHFSSQLLDIYNPFSLLNCLANSEITTNWFESGSSTFLINLIQRKRYELDNIEGCKATASRLASLSPDLSDPVPLLYQSGYLTIKDFSKTDLLYTLGYPNTEVKEGILNILIPYYLGKPINSYNLPSNQIGQWLNEGNPEKFIEWLAGVFATIPFDLHMKYEREYQAIIFSILNLVGLRENVKIETHMATGSTDIEVNAGRYVYIFELKLRASASAAVRQIEEKGYAEKFRGTDKTVFAIGLKFNAPKHTLSKYEIKQL